MKKLLFVLFLFAATQLVAQDAAKVLSKVAKSDEEIQNPKKALQAKTWISRAELFVSIWSDPVKNVMPGMSNRDVRLVLAAEKVKETMQEEIEGTLYEVDVYDNKKLYYDDKGMLLFWDATYPIQGSLLTALKAYEEAISLDGKGSHAKKIKAGLEDLQVKFQTDAYAAYNLHRYQEALSNFEGSLACSGNPLINKTDTVVIYYVGLIARIAGDNLKALEYFGKALDLGYTQDGDLYAAQAEVLQATGDTAASVQLLTDGLAKHPTNQGIIIGLINTFLQQGDDPKKILPYIEQAQQNDPDNSSLYYAQGVVYEQMNDFDNAVSAYKQSLEKDADNFFSNYALGAFFFNKAVQIQNVAAMEPDDKKYAEMIKDVDVYFDLSLPYLEHAYELKSSEVAVLESLKSLYFRMRERSPEMQQKYEYFNEKLQGI
jgi:tetratricopeptide (TPR) repeat protein